MTGLVLRHWQRLAMAVLVMALCGCATPLTPDDPFTRSDPKALIIFGLDDRVVMSEIIFSKYDPVRGRMQSVWTGHEKYDGMLLGYKKGLRFVAGKWDPGLYMVTSYCYGYQVCVILNPSLYFEVKSGKVNYLGNIMLGRETAGHIGYTDDLAKAYLADFKRVDAEFERVDMTSTPRPAQK